MSTIPDLADSKILQFQHKYSVLLSLGTNALMCLLIGALMNDFFGALVLATLGRMFIVHHGTWFINSAAHYWGERTYSKELSAVDNFFLALLTFGEGYHNYHHVFASDYRNGVKWYHYDPTKWLIWSLNKLGFAENLVRMDPYTTKKRLIKEDTRLVMEVMKEKFASRKEGVERYVNELSAKLNRTMEDVKQLGKEYRLLKRRKAGKPLLNPIKSTIKDLKKGFRKDWAQWCRVTKTIADPNRKKDKLFKELFASSA